MLPMRFYCITYQVSEDYIYPEQEQTCNSVCQRAFKLRRNLLHIDIYLFQIGMTHELKICPGYGYEA